MGALWKLGASCVLLVSVMAGCTTATQQTTPEALWRQADRQHADAIAGIARREQLQNDYAAIIRLTDDPALRGRAFVRLAELNLALGEYQPAVSHLEQALRAGLPPEEQSLALLLLGDVLDRYLNNTNAAATAYQQVVNEHPATAESELAQLRLEALSREM